MTLWYTLVLGLVIAAFSLMIYGDFSENINANIEGELRLKAGEISKVISSYNVEDLSEDAAAGVSKKLIAVDFVNAAKYAVKKSVGENLYIQIFNQAGKEIVHSENMLFILPLKTGSKSGNNPGTGVFSAEKIKLSGGERLPLKTFTIPSTEEDKSLYFIQVSETLKEMQKELDSLKAALFIVFPFIIFIVAAVGQFLTKMALRPVSDMTAAINRITSKNLKEKIVLPDADDEIKNLAETFNYMLARIDKAFTSQQRLVQDISHELRTPLTALKGNQEVTLAKKRRPAEYEKALEINLLEIDRMSGLVENLLLLAHLENKPGDGGTGTVKMGSLARRSADNIMILAKKKKIAISIEKNDDPEIYGDAEDISRIFSNIIDNAIKYTPEGGAIKVVIEKNGQFATARISDTGIGIGDIESKLIFDRFYRVDKSRSSSGFGLGLSIVKSIVEKYKGIIEVESSPGRGTTFIVSFPIKPLNSHV
jgi:heavy metal sensor kinase